MNTTNIIFTLKSLVKELKDLQDCEASFGLLYEQEIRLKDLRNEINRLIIKL